jgi:hypothetical protein
MPNNYYNDIMAATSTIEQAKSSIASAIAAKGVTVPQDASLGAYPALISNISSGITPTGTFNINSNGIYDVSIYADVSINVPTGGGDSSTRYGIKCSEMFVGGNNAGLFNTGYIPTKDTIVRLVGNFVEDGLVTHGSYDPNDEGNVFRLFAVPAAEEGEPVHVIYDRDAPGNNRLWIPMDGYDNDTYHEWEFGNFYVKIDGEIVEQGSDLDSNWSTTCPISIFGGLDNSNPRGVGGYAGDGAACAIFEIYEPGEGEDPDLVRRYLPAKDASGNLCWYEEFSETFLYATGTFDGAAYENEDPYIYNINNNS